MKKLIATAVMSVIALGATAGVIFTPIGPAKVNIDSIVETSGFALTSGKTNITATATNITDVYKATVSRTSFNGANLLALLTNSFNTNFPPGSQIGMQLGNLVVLDSTGTNVIFQPIGVVSFQFDEEFFSGTQTDVITSNKSGTSESGNASETITCSMTLNYDDTVHTTHDGTHTKFAFKGLCTVQLNENFATNVEKANLVFQGTGGGQVQGVNTILTGTISVKSSGQQVF